jgi:hypothetical protein
VHEFDAEVTSVQQYPHLQHFSNPFNLLQIVSWQGKEIRRNIRTLALNWAPSLDCPKDDGETAAETASDSMMMEVGQASCEFSVLVCQQSHSDLSFTTKDDALKQM